MPVAFKNFWKGYNYSRVQQNSDESVHGLKKNATKLVAVATGSVVAFQSPIFSDQFNHDFINRYIHYLLHILTTLFSRIMVHSFSTERTLGNPRIISDNLKGLMHHNFTTKHSETKRDTGIFDLSIYDHKETNKISKQWQEENERRNERKRNQDGIDQEFIEQLEAEPYKHLKLMYQDDLFGDCLSNQEINES